MRVVGLLSGGKDSCYALMQCVAAGHQVVAVATLLPPAGVEESDSHMYQSVGVRGVQQIAEAMGGLPAFTRTITGTSVNTTAHYPHAVCQDEVEDLYHLLKEVKEELPGGIGGVSSGAILSDYQRVRVEHVCGRLGLVSYGYLWRRDQDELLSEMISSGVEAVLVKVAGAGLVPNKHCGKTLEQMLPTLRALHSKFDLHICGEGGEFESFTLDCPLYEKRINIVEQSLVEEAGDVGYLLLHKLQLVQKQTGNRTSIEERIQAADIPTPSHYVADISTAAVVHDGSTDLSAQLSASLAVSQQDHQTFETKTVLPQRGVVVSSSGWWSTYGWQGDDVHVLLSQLHDDLSQHNISLASSSCEVRAFVRSLASYAEFNAAYKRHFGYNPPVRACVQTALEQQCQIEILGYNGSDVEQQRHTMHVQSVSHWAPANIGPYSQAVMVGELVHMAGMLGLVPGSMELIAGGAGQQTALAMRSITRVLSALTNSHASDAHHLITQMVVYSVSAEHTRMAVAALPELSCCLLHVQVERLPKDAAVELHVQAHTSQHRTKVESTSGVTRGGGLQFQHQVLQLAGGTITHLLTLDDNGSRTIKLSSRSIIELIGFTLRKLLKVDSEKAQLDNSVDSNCQEDDTCQGDDTCQDRGTYHSNVTTLTTVTIYYCRGRVGTDAVQDALDVIRASLAQGRLYCEEISDPAEQASVISTEEGQVVSLSAVPVLAMGPTQETLLAAIVNTYSKV